VQHQIRVGGLHGLRQTIFVADIVDVMALQYIPDVCQFKETGVSRGLKSVTCYLCPKLFQP